MSGTPIPVFLSGGGETGELIRSIDWSQTGLGSFEKWPQSLRTVVSVMMNTPFPMCIYWGKDYSQLYNDAYKHILGGAGHPHALGSSIRYTFKEAWNVIRPILNRVMKGKPVWLENFMLPVNRHGCVEQCFFDLSYSPILQDNGDIGGVLALMIETTEKINTRRKLEETQEVLHLALDAAELATWDYYPLTGVFTADKRYKEWVGIPPGKEIDFDLTQSIIIEKDRQRVQEALVKTLDYSSGGTLHIDYTIQPPEKSRRIVRAVGRAWFNEDRVAYRLSGTLQDLTEEVTSKKSIIKSEHNLRNIVLQAPVAMCVLKGPDYVVEIANEAMIELWGTRSEDVLNRPLFVGRPEAKGQGLEELLYQVYSTGERFSAHEKPMYLPRNGTMRLTYVNFIYEPLIETDGTILGVLAVATDVTDQVLARKKIEESEQHFRSLAETLPQLVWITDEKGVQLYASSRWMEYSGVEPTGSVTWQQIVHPADMHAIKDVWNDSIATGCNYSADVRLKNRGGEYRWHHVQAEPIRNEEGKIVKWIGAFTDIHDRKTITEKLELLVDERTAELQRSNDDLQQFAHVASHDLKEPLRKIKTFANRLEDDDDSRLSDKGKHYLSKVYSASDRLFSMIDGVLKYSMIDAQEQPVEVVDLDKIIRNIEADLEVLIQSKNAVIKYNQLHQVEGFSILIYQLFYNLINNSLKFARSEEHVMISIQSRIVQHQNMDFVEVCITDNGIGFDQHQADRIFNPFTRLHSKDRYEGTGLGLALCKKIVLRHHGVINALGSKDKGATFTILLPRKQPVIES